MRPLSGPSLAAFLVLGSCLGCTTIYYPAAGSPALTISPASLTFAAASGVTPPPQTVTLTNSGRLPVSMGAIALTGPGAADYAFNSSCGSVLAVAASCTLTVTFTPGAAPSFNAAISITDDASGSPQSVPLTAQVGPIPVVATAQYGFIGNDDGTINSFTISPSGAWTPSSPASVSIGDYMDAMVIDPLGKFLIAAGFINGSLTVYTITPGTGVLVPAFVYPNSSNRSEGMAIDPSGRCLYVNNGGNNTLSIFSIDRSTGALTPGSPAIIPTGDSYGVSVDPTGQFLYVNNLGDPTYPDIAMYSIDQATGSPTPLSPATVPSLPGFNVWFDPSGKFLYNMYSRDTGLWEYDLNQSTGLLTQVNSTDNVTPTGQGPTDFVVTPNGKFAYVTDRDGDQVSEYSVDPSTGALTQLPSSPIPLSSEPFAIVMDPSGNVAYIVCEGFGLAIMSVGADGQLSQVGTVNTTNFTVLVAVYPIAP